MYGHDPVSTSVLLLNKTNSTMPAVIDTEKRVKEALILRDRNAAGGKAASEADNTIQVDVRKSQRDKLDPRWFENHEHR